jgi:acetylornithine deacetylase/succinyl-diaminopimelate desuccinylase-like protein
MKQLLFFAGLVLCCAFVPQHLIAQEDEADNTLVALNPRYEKEIEVLIKQPKVKTAFDFILQSDPQTIKDHIFLTEIEAPPFKEEKRAAAFAKMLEAEGVDSVWIDAEGNVLALRRGTKGDRVVVLDAHLDTVFPEGTDVTVKVSGDTLFAPGVGDDTRGLSMVLAVLRAMNHAQIKTEADVLFIGTVGEEGLGDLRGVKYLFSENGPKIDSWIAIDGGDLGRINFKALGSYRFRVVVKGPGGHSWGAFGLGNPHHAMAAGIKYFVDAADVYTETGPRTSYNIGRMGGGTSVNSIPFESWAEIDMRSVRPERLDDLEKVLRETMQKGVDEQNEIRRIGRPLQLEVTMIGKRPSGELSPDLPLIQRAIASIEAFGMEAGYTRGSTDSNIPISLGIPAVTIGRGGEGGWGHSLLEWWANKDGYKSIQYSLLLLLSESGLAD